MDAQETTGEAGRQRGPWRTRVGRLVVLLAVVLSAAGGVVAGGTSPAAAQACSHGMEGSYGPNPSGDPWVLNVGLRSACHTSEGGYTLQVHSAHCRPEAQLNGVCAWPQQLTWPWSDGWVISGFNNGAAPLQFQGVNVDDAILLLRKEGSRLHSTLWVTFDGVNYFLAEDTFLNPR